MVRGKNTRCLNALLVATVIAGVGSIALISNAAKELKEKDIYFSQLHLEKIRLTDPTLHDTYKRLTEGVQGDKKPNFEEFKNHCFVYNSRLKSYSPLMLERMGESRFMLELPDYNRKPDF